ncbi:MAG: metallophosphoesterase [Candidatus Sumerlaeota bacterium]|nr:metallophosphoesterase [Candidatus Sumerlaeota bacterium]
MRLLVLSDLHLEFGCFIPRPTDVDVVVLAGDTDVGVKGIENARQLWPDKPIIYVLGNHEFYGHRIPRLIDQARRVAQGTNVYLLENDSVVLDSVRFLGCALWTDFLLFGLSERWRAMQAARQAISDFYSIRTDEGQVFTPAISIEYHQESLRWLMNTLQEPAAQSKLGAQSKSASQSISAYPTVVVTHHCPSECSVAACYQRDLVSAAFASRLSDLVAASGARLWIHGHTHDPFDYMIGSTRVVCNPRGYPFESDKGFNRSLIIDV